MIDVVSALATWVQKCALKGCNRTQVAVAAPPRGAAPVNLAWLRASPGRRQVVRARSRPPGGPI